MAMSNHEHHTHGGTGWSAAVSATLHCLTGCAIGEVAGMVIGTALGWSNGATIVLSIALAFFFGYALTASTVLRAGETLARAAKVAVGGGAWSSAVLATDSESTTLTHDDGSEAVVVLAHAQDRIVLDAECAEGSDTLGTDLEIAVVWRGPGVER